MLQHVHVNALRQNVIVIVASVVLKMTGNENAQTETMRQSSRHLSSNRFFIFIVAANQFGAGQAFHTTTTTTTIFTGRRKGTLIAISWHGDNQWTHATIRGCRA
jgi:hypothetical protein